MEKLKIMIVDDHVPLRRLVKSLLRPLASEVVECGNGQEAVDRYPQVQPDVVLMDIAMKPLDGLQASRQITARFPHARIFILTQYDEAGLRASAKRAGARGYLLKDNLLELPQLIEEQTRGGPGRRE
jgi:two-component system chemotaxis response regulator CheY